MTEKTPVQEAIREFEYCLQCLALELPEPVFKDVQARWREFKDALRTLQSGKGEAVDSETAWLVEREEGEQILYLYYDGWFQWTPDANKALRFARRIDADNVGAEAPDEYSVRIIEHMWPTPPEPVNSDKVDVEKLKRVLNPEYGRMEVWEDGYRVFEEGKDWGWNDCIDHLTTLGLLRSRP